jgi:hypothetical protein
MEYFSSCHYSDSSFFPVKLQLTPGLASYTCGTVLTYTYFYQVFLGRSHACLRVVCGQVE